MNEHFIASTGSHSIGSGSWKPDFIIAPAGKELVRITHDGRVIVAEGASNDEAARAFWDAVAAVRGQQPARAATTLAPEALQRAMDAACKAGEYAELPTRVYDALIEGWYALQERPSGPSYEALDIIARSVAGALERAGVTECDDPGEAIDVLREGYERRIAELQAAPAAAGVPDGYVLVPKQFGIPAETWDAAAFAFGGPSTGENEPFLDCTAWVGEIVGDEGQKTYGLHINCDECPEEGSITLAEFPAYPSQPAAQPQAEQPSADALPPLPPMGMTIAGNGPDRGHWYSAQQMQDYARSALAARQPAGEPAMWVSPAQLDGFRSGKSSFGSRIPARIDKDGLFTMPLYPAPHAAVDLGQFRPLAAFAYEMARNARADIHALAVQFLARIDSMAVR